MPIYAYRCTSCGHAKDVLQKVSDPLLTDCPACGAATFTKQVTAAGFQLKGSGWYVTDFRGGNAAAAKADGDGAADKGNDSAKDSAKDTSKDGAPAKATEEATAKAPPPSAEPAAAKAPAPAASTKPAAPPPAAGG